MDKLPPLVASMMAYTVIGYCLGGHVGACIGVIVGGLFG